MRERLGAVFSFERLDVWKEAIELADLVYQLTQEFPDYEKFGLANQMRRAAVSISSNIAEGNGRESAKDHCRFLEIAYGSTMELVSQVHIAQRQSFISIDNARDLYRKADKVARMLSGLRASLRPPV
jgi:four helix bundle protein